MSKIVKRLGSEGAGAPFGSVAETASRVGGVEEEFLFEGTAIQYRLAGGARDYPLDGHWTAEPMSEAPFRSRMVVLRPTEPDQFNGTVIVMWNNVSAGQDSSTGPISARQYLEDGFALVTVTAQAVGVYGIPSTDDVSEYYGRVMQHRPGLRDFDSERYATLVHPGDGYSYDIFTQAAGLISSNRPREIDPMGGLEVRHLIASGGSQSACRLATYIDAVAPKSSAFDGYLLLVYAGNPCALDPATAPARLDETGDNSVKILPFRTYILREDLGVPIITVNSETEAGQCHPNFQADTDLIRWWEFAGTSHLGLIPVDELQALLEAASADPVSVPLCRVSFAEAIRGARHALHRWLEEGVAPPHHPRLSKQGGPPALLRDEFGNAVGGIRWPEVAAPTATHVGESPPSGFINLMGHSTPFTTERLRSLYRDRGEWLASYRAATTRLVDTGVILPEDAEKMVVRASVRELPF